MFILTYAFNLLNLCFFLINERKKYLATFSFLLPLHGEIKGVVYPFEILQLKKQVAPYVKKPKYKCKII